MKRFPHVSDLKLPRVTNQFWNHSLHSERDFSVMQQKIFGRTIFSCVEDRTQNPDGDSNASVALMFLNFEEILSLKSEPFCSVFSLGAALIEQRCEEHVSIFWCSEPTDLDFNFFFDPVSCTPAPAWKILWNGRE